MAALGGIQTIQVIKTECSTFGVKMVSEAITEPPTNFLRKHASRSCMRCYARIHPLPPSICSISHRRSLTMVQAQYFKPFSMIFSRDLCSLPQHIRLHRANEASPRPTNINAPLRVQTMGVFPLSITSNFCSYSLIWHT